MAEQYDKNNMPDDHKYLEKVEFVAKTETSWTSKDGKNNPKWDFTTKPDAEGFSGIITVFSKTLMETLPMNTPLDVVVKRNRYGSTLQAFAPHGQPVEKREPRSFRDKQIAVNNKAIALQAAAQLYIGNGDDAVDTVLSVAEIYEAWLEGKYEPVKNDTDASSTSDNNDSQASERK